MHKKNIYIIFIILAFELSGCNGLGVLLNPPSETGYYSPTNEKNEERASTSSTPKGTSTVIRKAHSKDKPDYQDGKVTTSPQK